MSRYFLTYKFLYAVAIGVLLFILAFSTPAFAVIAWAWLTVIFIAIGYDMYKLRTIVDRLYGSRSMIEKWSLGESHQVKYLINNPTTTHLNFELVDETPEQLQFRAEIGRGQLNADDEVIIDQLFRPTVRGSYEFGKMMGYFSLHWPGIISMQKILSDGTNIVVYPNIVQMRKYELEMFSKSSRLIGIKRIRQIGEDDDFESIRPFVQGDQLKSINWKATSRANNLMVNQFQITRSQEIYTIIDKGRNMKMSFYGLTLLDHAINSSLVISNIILKKYDKAGIITFGKRIDQILMADDKDRQLDLIISSLYKQTTDFSESNYELLYHTMRQKIKRRSLMFFYTNFESLVDLERQLEYLKLINKLHLLVVIMFVNNEVVDEANLIPTNTNDVYYKTSLEYAILQKENIKKVLLINKIQCLLTKPEDLNINVINKYLEIKAMRGR